MIKVGDVVTLRKFSRRYYGGPATVMEIGHKRFRVAREGDVGDGKREVWVHPGECEESWASGNVTSHQYAVSALYCPDGRRYEWTAADARGTELLARMLRGIAREVGGEWVDVK